MNTTLAIAGGVLSVLLIFLRPTKIIGRGGPWVIVGSALLVASMMMLFFSVKDFGSPGGGDDDETAGLSQENVDALTKAFGN